MSKKAKEDNFIEEEGMSIGKKVIVILSLLVVFVCGAIYYSRYIATSGLWVKENKITNANLPNGFHGTKIVQFSDLHYKTTYFLKDVKKLVKKINQIKPDIVVFTGDMLDQNIKYSNEDLEQLAKELDRIEVTINKYAISGEQDEKFTEWETLIKDSGFVNLNDGYETIFQEGYEPILIAGARSSLMSGKNIEDRLKPISDIIEKAKKATDSNQKIAYRILLMHEPDYIEDFDYQQFNLILAGHSHDGQMRIPGIGGIILPEKAQKYYRNHYSLNGTEFYISSGLGTSGYFYRLFNRPSINLYRLTNK